MRFFIVDVFAEQKYQGNQLAVVFDEGRLSSEEMLQITREMNYSETTFLGSGEEKDGGFGVRIFTPGSEVPFAGHPTIGSAFIVQQKVIGRQVDRVNLDMGVGRIPVSFDYCVDGPQVMWMRQAEPSFGAIIPPGDMAPILGLDPADLDPRFPIQEVSTGFPFFIVPLNGLEAARRARVNTDRLFSFIENTWARAILVVSGEAEQAGYDLHVRGFVHCFGIPEDPATGSANGCLAAWLSHHQYFGSDEVDCKVEQGMEMGRPSTLLLRSGPEGDGLRVEVGGRAIMVAEGKLLA